MQIRLTVAMRECCRQMLQRPDCYLVRDRSTRKVRFGDDPRPPKFQFIERMLSLELLRVKRIDADIQTLELTDSGISLIPPSERPSHAKGTGCHARLR